jgi:hypothetical protein
MNGNPWDQDDGLDGDDFVEGIDDEDEELGIDYTARHGGAHDLEDDDEPAPLGHHNGKHHPRPQPQRKRALRGPDGRKFRIRRMSPKMAARSPNVATILITKNDGSQVLIVRKDGR